MRIDITSFNGCNLQADPLRLPDGLGAWIIDSRPVNGNLRPFARRQAVATLPTGRRSIYRMGSGTAANWLTWSNELVHVITGFDREDTQGRIYFTGATGGPQWTDNTMALASQPYPAASRPLAVSAPVNAPVLTVQGAGTSSTEETRTYVTTFVNDLGWESAPSPAATVVCKADATVRLSSLEDATSGQGTNRRRIYRTRSGTSASTEFFFLAELVYASGGQQWTEGGAALSNDVLRTAGATTLGAWLPCPHDATWLTKLWNGMASVIVGKTVRVCVPNTLYAWPLDQEIVLADQPVAKATWGQNVLVLTDGGVPSIITGQDPMSMSEQPLEGLPFNGACVSPASVLSLGHGVVWAGPDGLNYYGSMGAKVLTAGLIEPNEWRKMRPETFHAAQLEGLVLLASTSMRVSPAGGQATTGAFGMLVDPGGSLGLHFMTIDGDVLFKDPRTSELFCLATQTGQLTELQRQDAGQFVDCRARSKVFRTPRTNMGYARVIATSYPVTLTLFADGLQVTQQDAVDDDVFALPSGYESGVWQVEVAMSARAAAEPPQVTSVHLADDPLELME